MGVVAAGYADGYPRHAPGGTERGTPVLVDGHRTRTVGRVSMDMMCADLTALPEAMRILADPAETGAVTLTLPEDVQAESLAFPAHFFEKRVYTIDLPRPRVMSQVRYDPHFVELSKRIWDDLREEVVIQ